MLRWLCLAISIELGCVSYSGQPGGPRDAIVGAGNLPPQPALRTALAGRVVAGSTSLSRVFVSFEKVVLYSDDRIVAETATDAHGNFVFATQISDGRYEIAVQSERYQGSLSVVFRGAPLTRLEMVVTTKGPD